MSSELIRQRSDLINTQVITIDTAKSLGVVKEVLVDIDSREVVALGLRDNIVAVPGNLARYMLLSSIRKLGDSILVDNDDVIEDIDPEAYTSLVNCEVVTESNYALGKVRGFRFSCEDGRLTSIIIASIGLPLIPDQVISTYELSIDEVVANGPNKLIVIEGTEERLDQLSVGFLERIGLGKAPWEDEYADYRPTVVRPENQLPAGMPVAPPPMRAERPPARMPIRMPEPEPITYGASEAIEETTWEDDKWQDTRPAPPPLKAEVVAYEEVEPDDTWSDISRDVKRVPARPPVDEEIIDVWEDDNWSAVPASPPATSDTGKIIDIDLDLDDLDDELPPAAAVVRR
jgi:sporulation protein YlmC with PRC-barrel domain